MATINLGKVVPVYKGTYSAGTYDKYNVVFDGESSFISLKESNTAALSNDGVNWLYLCRGNNTALAAQAIQIAGIISDEKNMYPAIAYYKRVIADSGAVNSKNATDSVYQTMIDLLPSTAVLYCPEMGAKVSGGTVSKLYDATTNNNDAAQATVSNQPYITGNIAPNEKKAIKNMNTSTDVSLNHTAITKANTASWSVVTTLKYSGKRKISNSGDYAGNGNGTVFYFDRTNDGRFAIYDVSNSIEILSTSGSSYQYFNKNTTIIWTYNNGVSRCYANGISVPLITQGLLSLNINTVLNGYTRNFAGNIYYHQILNKELSATEVQNVSTFLGNQYPEIEGVNIGNQHWATSNYEGVIDAIGTVIPEVQSASTSAELLSPIDLTTGWVAVSLGTTIDDENTITTSIGSGGAKKIYLTVGKVYNLTFAINTTATNCKVYNADGAATGAITSGVNFVAVSTYIYIRNEGIGTSDITSISLKEVGWADLTTPAWCYYNNDPALGAIYGKLYNHYAVDVISANPPSGWRVPTKADFTQLIAYLGGSTVAGGKSKLQGLTYWATPNSGATNESGFSGIAGGLRGYTAGGYVYNTNYGFFQTSDEISSGYYGYGLNSNTSIFDISSSIVTTSPKSGMSLRLIRNSPVGADVQKLTTGVFTTDITSTYKLLNIPFGYQVTAIKVNCASNVTAFECKMYDYAGSTLQSTLVTGKTATANIPIKFGVVADSPIQYQDAQLRFTCAKSVSTANLEIGVVIEKIL